MLCEITATNGKRSNIVNLSILKSKRISSIGYWTVAKGVFPLFVIHFTESSSDFMSPWSMHGNFINNTYQFDIELSNEQNTKYDCVFGLFCDFVFHYYCRMSHVALKSTWELFFSSVCICWIVPNSDISHGAYSNQSTTIISTLFYFYFFICTFVQSVQLTINFWLSHI